MNPISTHVDGHSHWCKVGKISVFTSHFIDVFIQSGWLEISCGDLEITLLNLFLWWQVYSTDVRGNNAYIFNIDFLKYLFLNAYKKTLSLPLLSRDHVAPLLLWSFTQVLALIYLEVLTCPLIHLFKLMISLLLASLLCCQFTRCVHVLQSNSMSTVKQKNMHIPDSILTSIFDKINCCKCLKNDRYGFNSCFIEQDGMFASVFWINSLLEKCISFMVSVRLEEYLCWGFNYYFA